jgi:hypothetical protein
MERSTEKEETTMVEMCGMINFVVSMRKQSSYVDISFTPWPVFLMAVDPTTSLLS